LNNIAKMKSSKMKRILPLILLAIITFVFNSCIKTANSTAELKVRVIDEQGIPFQNAVVYLYETQYDYLHNTNLVLKTTTDYNGYLHVIDLAPIAYYYFIESDCYDNYNTTQQLPSALVPNTINVYDPIVLSSVGQLLIQNNTYYPYAIYLDGSVVCSTLPAGQNLTVHEVPTGRHIVRIAHQSVYDTNPLDGSNTYTVSCGATTPVNFP